VRRTLKVAADPRAVSMAEAIRRMAEVAPLLVIGGRALSDLAAELGGPEAATGWLAELAQEVGRPLGVNLPTGPDTSSTAFIAPKHWSSERLQGWLGGHHEVLEAEFGEVARVGPEFPAPGGQG
jgi:hypothetical protein